MMYGDDDAPPPPPGLPTVPQRITTLKLMARAQSHSSYAKLTGKNLNVSRKAVKEATEKIESNHRHHHCTEKVTSSPNGNDSVPSEISFSSIPYKEIFADDDNTYDDFVCGNLTTGANNQASIFRDRRNDTPDRHHRSASSSSSPCDEMTTKQIWNLRGLTLAEKESPRNVDGSDIRENPPRPRFFRTFFHRSPAKGPKIDNKAQKSCKNMKSAF